MLFSYFKLIYIGLPQPWSARTYIQFPEYSIDDLQQREQLFSSAVNKKESINGISVHASYILRSDLSLKFYSLSLSLRKVIRKPNKPQYPGHTFLQ